MTEHNDRNGRIAAIQGLDNLPTLPASLMRIIEVVENPDSSAEDLARVVAEDQSVSSLILRLVNSAFYGHMRQISSISHAVVILGYQTVKTMALGVSVFHGRAGGKGEVFDRSKLWVHCIGVATFAKMLATRVVRKGVDREAAFLAGLLHDMGKVALENLYAADYQDVVRAAVTQDRWIGDVERERFGLCHAEAGYHLARKWHFPEQLVMAIRYHHDLAAVPAEGYRMAAVVQVADYCCRKIRLGSAGDAVEAPLDREVKGRLEITEEQLAELIFEVEEQRAAMELFAHE